MLDLQWPCLTCDYVDALHYLLGGLPTLFRSTVFSCFLHCILSQRVPCDDVTWVLHTRFNDMHLLKRSVMHQFPLYLRLLLAWYENTPLDQLSQNWNMGTFMVATMPGSDLIATILHVSYLKIFKYISECHLNDPEWAWLFRFWPFFVSNPCRTAVL